jgi:hypothetical protein
MTTLNYLDETPITQEWLLSIGFKFVPSSLGPEYDDHLEFECVNIWNFNNLGIWLYNDCDSINIRTRGELFMLAKLLKVNITP